MINIYNSMSGKKEEFKPITPNKVKMYVCGVTVYDFCHIGHARSSVVFDLIRRYLMFSNYEVEFVKNFTDIDDKIINRANANNEVWSELTEKYIHEHNTDMDSLNIMHPSITPKATDYIGEMINYIKRLIDGGYAYSVDGDVYFKVESFKDYGKLSKRNIDDLLAGARVDINDKKVNPLDFALWKSAKPGEPFWDSPWGNGRPGWHIECSVMSEDILGANIDIHGGGQDLIFPHHENEIAQSESLSCKTFANYWVHNGFVNINKEKMSKSLNNFFTIRDILKICDAEVLRFFFLTTQYRQPLEYSEDKLVEVKVSLSRIYNYLDELGYCVASQKGKDLTIEAKAIYENFITEFHASMNDDFNTPKALAALFEVVRLGNTIIAAKPNVETLEILKNSTEKIVNVIKDVLGVLTRAPQDWYKANLKMSEDEVLKLIERRSIARANKDFKTADEVRKQLLDSSIELVDTVNGTRYKTL